MHEAMNRKKTSSGTVFSVFAEKESNASAGVRMGIRSSHVGARRPEKSLMWQASGWLSSIGEIQQRANQPTTLIAVFLENLLALRLSWSILEVWISPVPIGQEGNL
jgi:hypothetical protein